MLDMCLRLNHVEGYSSLTCITIYRLLRDCLYMFRKCQTITFHPETDTLDDIMTLDDIHVTKLTAFFDACVKYPKLIFELLYLDCPSKFI